MGGLSVVQLKMASASLAPYEPKTFCLGKCYTHGDNNINGSSSLGSLSVKELADASTYTLRKLKMLHSSMILWYTILKIVKMCWQKPSD